MERPIKGKVMIARPLRTLILVVSLISNVYSAAAIGGARGPGIDQQPMYGGIDRSAYPELAAADQEFISAVPESSVAARPRATGSLNRACASTVRMTIRWQ